MNCTFAFLLRMGVSPQVTATFCPGAGGCGAAGAGAIEAMGAAPNFTVSAESPLGPEITNPATMSAAPTITAESTYGFANAPLATPAEAGAALPGSSVM